MSVTIRLLGCICTNNEPIEGFDIVVDHRNRLYELGLALGGASLCLRFIDIYGDLMVNEMQVSELLIPELRRLRSVTQDPEDFQLIERVESLARHISDEPHRNLWFLGD